ncbi:MAG: hypothetical protein K2X39_06635 [Silvanigrellaceae bacterium]|nr:hypothetical protein [Silvanigrellaceae bacterium]
MISCLLIFSLVFHTNPLKANTEEKNIYKALFRPGHHLTFLAGVERSRWRLKADSNSNAQSSTTENISPVVLFRYAYHMHLLGRFGIFLGTTAGYIHQQTQRDAFDPNYAVILPSAMFGIVQNFTADERYLIGVEFAAIRYPEMRVTQKESSQRISMASTLDSLDVYGALEHFFTKDLAVSFQIGWRYVQNTCIGDCSKSMYLNNFDMTDSAFFALLGVNWQVGDLLGI